MTYYYKGKEIGGREDTMKFIMALPCNELYNFVYAYLDHFDEEHLKDMIWALLDNRGWKMTNDIIEDALLMMESDWDLAYSMDTLFEEGTVSLGDFEYENWVVVE